MSARDIIVIGGSAGGVEALVQLAAQLPAHLPAAAFVVLHRLAQSSGELPGLLTRSGQLPALYPTDGERIARGRMYVAPPGAHLLVQRGQVRLQTSPREQSHRPAINPLFRSAAAAYGCRVAGVILTGTLDDGTAGLWEIKKRGGVAILQDPKEARFPAMPQHALENVEVDYCLPLAQIAPLLTELACREPAPSPVGGPQPAKILIVEDERIVAKNLERRLREFGYQVNGSVSSGEEAIAVAEKTQPDLALMDIRLAGAMDGAEAARVLWERLHIPVVYITAHTDADTIAQLKGSPAYGYVVKPFQPREIHAAIQLAFDRRNQELCGF